MPGGDVPSPRGALRRTRLPMVSPVPGVRRRLCFMGLQQILDPVDEVTQVDEMAPELHPDPGPVPAEGLDGPGRDGSERKVQGIFGEVRYEPTTLSPEELSG